MEQHPSGIENEAELAYVSADFFSRYSDACFPSEEVMWDALLNFQKGWKACKDYYENRGW
jgi:hypothetical protein